MIQRDSSDILAWAEWKVKEWVMRANTSLICFTNFTNASFHPCFYHISSGYWIYQTLRIIKINILLKILLNIMRIYQIMGFYRIYIAIIDQDMWISLPLKVTAFYLSRLTGAAGVICSDQLIWAKVNCFLSVHWSPTLGGELRTGEQKLSHKPSHSHSTLTDRLSWRLCWSADCVAAFRAELRM